MLRYIYTKTTIPIPYIHAYGQGELLTKDRSELLAYLILGYVPGHSLNVQSLAKDSRERRDFFYTQLIDVLAQMRQLEFPSAGSLFPTSSGAVSPIVGPLLTIPINEMQIQGYEATTLSNALTSVSDFVLYQFGTM